MAHAFSMSLLILCRGIAQQNGTAQGYVIWSPDPHAPTNPEPPIPGEGYEPHCTLFLARPLIARRTLPPPPSPEAVDTSPEDPTVKKKYEPTNTHL